MDEDELRLHHREWAMEIAAKMHVPKETALAVLDQAKEWIILLHEKPEDRSEAA